jgi:hypothetical protein
MSSAVHGENTQPQEAVEPREERTADTSVADAGHEEDEDSSIDHIHEKAATEKVGKRTKVKRHCWKFKWWYIVGVIILLAILLPLLFEVIIPAIVQSIVNSQSLPVHEGAFHAVSPTQVRISLRTSLDTPLGVTLEPTDLYLYNKDTPEYSPFVKILLPGQYVEGETMIQVKDRQVPIDNQDELIKFFTNVFVEPDVKLSVKAKPNVRLGALKYQPTIDKTLDLPALNFLKGFGITEMQFNLAANNTGPNLTGKVNLPNSGALTLGLGNLTLNLESGDVRLGVLTVYNTLLAPGDNIRDFDGEFYFKELVPNLPELLASQSGALGEGNIELNATGNATVVNGERIPYVESVLKGKKLTFHVPLLTLLGNVLSGVLDSEDSGSLLGVFGDVFGNTTLFEHIIDRWDSNVPSNTTSGNMHAKLKRSSPKASLAMSMLKLGLRSKK